MTLPTGVVALDKHGEIIEVYGGYLRPGDDITVALHRASRTGGEVRLNLPVGEYRISEPCHCCHARRFFVTPSLFEGYDDHIDICTRCGGSGIEPGYTSGLVPTGGPE